MRDQVIAPVRQLPLALKPKTIKFLWVNVVALQQLEHSGEQCLGVTGVLVESTTETIEDQILILCRILQIANQ